MNNKDKSAYQGGKKNQAAAATIQTIGPLLTLAVKNYLLNYLPTTA